MLAGTSGPIHRSDLLDTNWELTIICYWNESYRFLSDVGTFLIIMEIIIF